MQFDTILFDMDGTLFDTEKIYHIGWNKAGVPDEVYYRFIGTSRPHVEGLIRNEAGLDPIKGRAEKDAYVQQILKKDGVPIKPHLIETLRWLKENGYHSCIATSSAMEVAENYLKLSGTGAYFDKIVSGNKLGNGKPAPDIYLMAAREMSAVPGQCVVVEDSFNGVRSGHNAGMKTVMIPDLVPPDDEMKKTADAILHDLGELPDYLKKLNKTSFPEGMLHQGT